jgi:hypothetical protein
VKANYHVIEGQGKSAERPLAAFCKANGQMLLPLVELIEQARLTVSRVLDQVSQQTIEKKSTPSRARIKPITSLRTAFPLRFGIRASLGRGTGRGPGEPSVLVVATKRGQRSAVGQSNL